MELKILIEREEMDKVIYITNFYQPKFLKIFSFRVII
jgi:hypothetical protein